MQTYMHGHARWRQVDSSFAPAHFNAGNVYLRKHSYDGNPEHLRSALRHCESALEIDNRSVHALVFAGEALLRLGDEAAGATWQCCGLCVCVYEKQTQQ